MDFYKLSNFQLYSIIHSRHLDKAQKEVAERELARRNLTPEELQQLKDELAEKEKSYTKLSPNIYIAILVLIAIMILRQGTCN